VSAKRKASTDDSISRPVSNKRHRSEEVIVIDSDEEATSSAGNTKKVATAFGGSKFGNRTSRDIEALDYAEVIKCFKLDLKKLA
jgi:hypothetical protein